MSAAQKYMSLALSLAQKIDPHKTAPNPRVGCVIVHQGMVVSTGVHEQYGTAHAEQNAIKSLEEQGFQDWKTAEIFVTLEPCDSFEGKQTPSCTQCLLEKKFKKVWVGTLDPLFQGKNIQKLKQFGVDVELLDDRSCQKLNPFFGHFVTKKRSFLSLKIAQSLDGKITSTKKYITNEISRRMVHRMRAQYSVILTTTETILKDNPLLDCRLEPGVLKHETSNPTVVILGQRELPHTEPYALNIFKLPDRKLLFFKTLDEFLQSEEIKTMDSIMTECGAEMNSALLAHDLVDEVRCFVAPQLLGHKEKNSFVDNFDFAQWSFLGIEKYENDLCFRYQK